MPLPRHWVSVGWIPVFLDSTLDKPNDVECEPREHRHPFDELNPEIPLPPITQTNDDTLVLEPHPRHPKLGMDDWTMFSTNDEPKRLVLPNDKKRYSVDKVYKTKLEWT